MRFLEEHLVAFNVTAHTPEQAIRIAGNLLVKGGHVREKYVDAMVNSYKVYGSYIVIAPEIAIPHARPEDGVKEASVSFVQLNEPVNFGSDTNDPVYLIFALGASNSDEHLQLLKKLTNILADQRNVEEMKNASSYEEIKSILKGEEIK